MLLTIKRSNNPTNKTSLEKTIQLTPLSITNRLESGKENYPFFLFFFFSESNEMDDQTGEEETIVHNMCGCVGG